MKTTYRALTAILAVAMLALATMAKADCGPDGFGQKSGATLRPQAWNGTADLAELMTLVSDGDPIVGFWKVKLTAKDTPGIPDGAVIDNAFQQWHSDGTELMNSSRDPATGSFCMGVWKKIAAAKYRLNHFALSWDPNHNFVGPANIRSIVVLSDNGNQFTGTFTIDQYDPNGNLLVHIQGEVAGKRITVYTGIASVL